MDAAIKIEKYVADAKGKNFWKTAVERVDNEVFTERKINKKGETIVIKKSKYGGKQMIIKAVSILSLFFGSYALILILPSKFWFGVPLVVLISIGFIGLGMGVMHDAAHDAFSEKQWVNDVVKFLSMAFMGLDEAIWRIDHNLRHHMPTNTPEDGDLKTHGLMKRSIYESHKWFHRYQHYYWWIIYSFFIFSRFFGEIFEVAKYKREGYAINPTKEYIKMFFIKTIYLFFMVVLPVLITDYTIYQVLGAFLVFNFATGFVFTTVFQLAHVVKGVKQSKPVYDEKRQKWVIYNEWHVHELEATSDFVIPRIFSWLIGGLDFQIEHHLFREISSVHYPKIRPILKALCAEFDYPYTLKPSILASLESHLEVLKDFGLNLINPVTV